MEQFKNLSEIELINRILTGNKQLYEVIVRRFNPYLYKIGRSYNFNHEDTQDLMQDSFIDAFKALATFEGRSAFKSWILRIMLNNCHRKREKFSFIYETSMDIADDAKPMFNQSDMDTSSIIQQREIKNVLEDALSQVPLEYRMVFSLREINGLDIAETAQVLAISESNVKVRLNRAKSKLRTEIEKNYNPAELYEFNLIYCNYIAKKVMAVLVP